MDIKHLLNFISFKKQYNFLIEKKNKSRSWVNLLANIYCLLLVSTIEPPLAKQVSAKEKFKWHLEQFFCFALQ